MEFQIRLKLKNYFESHPKEWSVVVDILTYRHDITPYFLERFFQTVIQSKHFLDKNGDAFFIGPLFSAEKKGYGKKFFNYKSPNWFEKTFLGEKGKEVYVFHDKKVSATLAVLHFLYWCIFNDVLDYIIKNQIVIKEYIDARDESVSFD